RSRREAISAGGALSAHDLETEIDDTLLRPLPGDRRQRHCDGTAADLVAGRAYAAQRRKGNLHHVEVVEADDADSLRHVDRSTVAFEQDAEGEVVIVAEDRVERGHLGQRIAKQLPTKGNAGRHRRSRDETRIVNA